MIGKTIFLVAVSGVAFLGVMSQIDWHTEVAQSNGAFTMSCEQADGTKVGAFTGNFDLDKAVVTIRTHETPLDVRSDRIIFHAGHDAFVIDKKTGHAAAMQTEEFASMDRMGAVTTDAGLSYRCSKV